VPKSGLSIFPETRLGKPMGRLVIGDRLILDPNLSASAPPVSYTSISGGCFIVCRIA
jgi:hypothetical protein